MTIRFLKADFDLKVEIADPATKASIVYYHENVLDAALCLLDAILIYKAEVPDKHQLNHYFDERGAVAIRNDIAARAVDLERIWLALSNDRRDLAGEFDFDFVPLILKATTFYPDAMFEFPDMAQIQQLLETSAPINEAPG